MSPPPCTIRRVHTNDLDPVIRREAWREIAHWQCDFQPSPDVPLDANMHILHGEAAIFGSTRSSAYEMRTGVLPPDQREDLVVISLIQAGRVDINAAPGDSQHLERGSIGLFMLESTGHFRWSHNACQAFVDLPRSQAVAALGRDPGKLFVTLERCVLMPALSSQLELLAQLVRLPSRLDAVEFAGMLDTTRALALLALHNLGRQVENDGLPDEGEGLHAGRRAAALRFMAQHGHRHDLDIAAIAHGIGCSRTRLCEAFTEQAQTVMGALREVRLSRAKAMIEANPRQHLGALSWRCGFADQANFTRVFKARFGFAPSATPPGNQVN